MAIDIREEGVGALTEYATIPIGFWVRSQMRVERGDGGMSGIFLTEESVEPPYLKDYDALGDGPATWRRWDMSKWGVFVGRDDGVALGGAVIAMRTPGLEMLEGRDDLAVLWDIRVRPERRRNGLGRRLLERAASWAREWGCRSMKIETQNNNVPACRFYAACGGRLGGIHPGAYRELPDELMLLWYLDL